MILNAARRWAASLQFRSLAFDEDLGAIASEGALRCRPSKEALMKNHLKEIWSSGGVATGGWLIVPHRLTAMLMADVGFDYLCIDMQHGLIDLGETVAMLQSLRGASPAPLVRVARNDSAIIGQVLDAGALGVIIPMVNSAADAEAAVRSCRYAPEGSRSWGPTYASRIYGDSSPATANAAVLCIPMIETAAAIEAVDDILDVPGVDAIYVGPSDLAITYGLDPAGDRLDLLPETVANLPTAGSRRGVIAGIHTTPELAQLRRTQGFRMVTVCSDTVALAAGARQMYASGTADGDAGSD